MTTPQDRTQLNKRQVVMAGSLTLLKWLGGATASGVIGNFAYDKIPKSNTHIELEDLLPSFSQSQLVPGSHHPEEGFHPDVYDALCGLTSILVGPNPTQCVNFIDLPVPSRSGNLLLLGGPISNELSRELHGHTLVNKKISILPTIRSGFRWHFYYPQSVPGEPPYSRYVSGRLEPKMRKAIIDTKAPDSAKEIDSQCGADGLIATDYLLITVQPNTLVRGSGTSIILDSSLKCNT